MTKIKIGDFIPSFALLNQHGETVSSDQFRGKKLVIFFYPKDNTPGCTAEACSFRDNYGLFKAKGTEILGISSDSVETHKKFAKKHNLTYSILSDGKGKVRKLFGVPKILGFIPGRVTYMVDENGKVVHIFDALLDSKRHIQEALSSI
ncbi:MAG: peroxiredoxin [Flavobacteriales bacterium]